MQTKRGGKGVSAFLQDPDFPAADRGGLPETPPGRLAANKTVVQRQHPSDVDQGLQRGFTEIESGVPLPEIVDDLALKEGQRWQPGHGIVGHQCDEPPLVPLELRLNVANQGSRQVRAVVERIEIEQFQPKIGAVAYRIVDQVSIASGPAGERVRMLAVCREWCPRVCAAWRAGPLPSGRRG